MGVRWTGSPSSVARRVSGSSATSPEPQHPDGGVGGGPGLGRAGSTRRRMAWTRATSSRGLNGFVR